MGKHKKHAHDKSHKGGTRATVLLTKAGADYTTHNYKPDPESDIPYAEEAADCLGVKPTKVFKTLVTLVDKDPTLALVPASSQLDLKALAHAVGGSKATLADSADAERLTGYVVGGISPFGTKRSLPVVADGSIVDHKEVYVSAGKRGLQLSLKPSVLLDLLNARTAPIARRS